MAGNTVIAKFVAEKTATIRIYVKGRLGDGTALQTNLLHPVANAFQRLGNQIAAEIVKKRIKLNND